MSWTISNALMQSYESYENSRFSPELVAESSAASCVESEPSAPSKSTPTVALYCAPDKMMGRLNLSRYGMTCAHLTDDLGAGLLMWFQRGFRVQTSASRIRMVAESMAKRAGYGRKQNESLAKYDPVSSSLKIAQISLIKEVSESLKTLPPWGMIARGVLFPLPTPELHTLGVDGGALLWPTPTVTGNHNRKGASATSGNGLATAVKWRTPTVQDAKNRTLSADGNGNLKLSGQVKMLPTPTASLGRHGGHHQQNHGRPGLQMAAATWPTPRTSGMCGGSGGWEALKKATENVEEARKMGAGNGGQLNPRWVEWLMACPIGWTSLEPLEICKFRRFLKCFGTLSQEKNYETDRKEGKHKQKGGCCA